MDHGYELYCLADRHFYDSPVVTRGDDVDFDAAERPAPEGWTKSELDDWLVYRPEEARLPAQGWKVHVSACLENADDILAVVFDYCVPRRIVFKFIRSRQLLLLRNGKYADRGSSGKFVTIYPRDEAQLQTILTELGERLDGRPGPYILSDLRWGRGPLYVRYGGFDGRHCIGENGEIEPAIADDTGELVPDRRGPTFSLPAWVELPGFLAPHLAARGHETVGEVPYRIDKALHFSNGGGLYAGVDLRTDEPVVLKEARPWAGLATDGADAVERLTREHDVLRQLAGIEIVPAVRDFFTLAEHRFLVLDLVDGTVLSGLMVERYPLTRRDPDEVAMQEYTSWALDMYGRLERAVDAVHGRGIVIGDLHPFNVLVRPEGALVLIDFEVASHVSEGRRPTVAEPGFMAPRRCTGFDIDRYALACLRLHMFLPLTNLLLVDPAKAADLADEIAAMFPVPRRFVDEAVEVIASSHGQDGKRPAVRRRPALEACGAGWQSARASMARAITASATPDRHDRLFPGDIRQFETGGLNLAYGAAGVLYALDATGAGRHPDHEEWLVRQATNPEPGTRLGFYEGLHGVAWVLDRLDHPSEALKVLDICTQELGAKWERLGLDLYSGLAGIGLNLAHFASSTGDPSLADAAWRVADVVADRLGSEDSVAEISGGDHPYAGLFRGSSGPALLFVRLYELNGDTTLLDLAATALRQDLRRCVTRDGGVLHVDEGWRSMPYLAEGSAGIGVVLQEYLRHREDERFARALDGIRAAAEGRFYIEPGLFYGRAGMILFVSRDGAPGGRDADDPVVAGHIRRLAWHAMDYQGHLAFPGEQLLRLSMDLGSGTAGVLLAMGAALGDSPIDLPFLRPEAAHVVNRERR